MLIIPAVDIRGGRCVRLVHGDPGRETVYHEDPLEAALRWQRAGASRLHLVDLDGAFCGVMKNAEIIGRIAAKTKIPVQVGGGIRDMATARDLLSRGAWRVVLGTAAVTDPELVAELCAGYPGRVVVGIDTREGTAAIRGWVENSGMRAVDLALSMVRLGAAEIIHTDIGRDGTLSGPNLTALKEMAEALPVGVIASGGVSSLGDIKDILALKEYGVTGVIVGQALYTGRLDLKEAVTLASGGGS